MIDMKYVYKMMLYKFANCTEIYHQQFPTIQYYVCMCELRILIIVLYIRMYIYVCMYVCVCCTYVATHSKS